MNRTRKIVAAGIGTAVILAVIAVMLLAPPLHTSTPASTSPPSNGGTGGGGSGGTGTGTGPGSGTGSGSGAGNGTTANCPATGNGDDWDHGNETESGDVAAEPTNGNGTGNHDETGCTGSDWDPDSHGDQESAAHSAVQAAREVGDMLVQGVQALLPFLSGGLSALGNGIASLGGLLVEPLAGAVSAATASA